MPQNTKPIVYPPVVIAHISKDIKDLYAPKIQNKDLVQIHYSAQLNGHPHMGTLTSLATAFAAGEYLHQEYNIPQIIKFEALENAPGDKLERDGVNYCRMLSDSIKNGKPLSEIYLQSFLEVLNHFSTNTKVPYEIESYREFQSHLVVRETLLKILSREEEFAPFIAPSEKRLRVRFPCPECKFMEKDSLSTKIIQSNDKYNLTLESNCYNHGPHTINLSPSSQDFVDFNTSIRNVIKEAKFIEDARKANAFNLMVDGGDWIGMAYQVANSLDLLGYRFKDMPTRLFTPIIEDWSGAKFSKSVYVSAGTYADIPEEFVNYDILKSKWGNEGLNKILQEARSWVRDSKKLFRNYSIEYWQNIFK